MQKVLIVDFGGQHKQLIARRVRQCHVYCEAHPWQAITADFIREFAPAGIILTGGEESVLAADAPTLPREIYDMGIPMLGIGYGCSLMAKQLGGAVSGGEARPCGRVLNILDPKCLLFLDFVPESVTWMSRGDRIESLPAGFTAIAHTMADQITGFGCPEKGFFGVQFHPEDSHTDGGDRMFHSFLAGFCHCAENWQMDEYVITAIAKLREQIGKERVLLALSGGLDSSVTAALLSRAIGSQLTCNLVDHGFLRKNEADEVEAAFSHMDLNFIRVNAQDRFLAQLKGVTDPAVKRRIIGDEFLRVFGEEARKLGKIHFFAKGTIYPDIIDSGANFAGMLKHHEDAEALPAQMGFQETLEPLRMLFKDEVRQLGRAMGLPLELLNRQSFPGPGLAIRVMGEVTGEKLAVLRHADHIFRTELNRAHMGSNLGQYFAVLTDASSGRTGGFTLALRAVTTDDFITAKWARIPYELLDSISAQIIQEVPGVSRIVYDITSKPPATIEWE